ncbi:hypothetical protein [Ruegeria atlantica]|uniref:hypothetical protein n=1 Tax=Ruegeria atlantica TaxID=81569 RepID=UPI001479CB1A|nr:hypothetical protein [Ruegeria atlantica]
MYLARIDTNNCAVNDLRKDEFARNYTLLDDSAVYARWKKGSWQITRIGDIWKRSGKVFSVPYEGTDSYPSFQFAEDGTPHPLMEKVLKALPDDMTPWQRALWMATPKAELAGRSPANCIQTGDDRVVDIAAQTRAHFFH